MLLQELQQQQLLEPNLISQLKKQNKPDIVLLRQLIHQQWVSEEALLPFFSERYGLSLIPSMAVFQALEDQKLAKRIEEQSQILVGHLEGKLSGLVSVASDLGWMDHIQLQFQEDITWYWCTQMQKLSFQKDEPHEDVFSGDASITEQVTALLEKAIFHQSSDLHLESSPYGLRVRMRVDGELQELQQFPKEQQAAMVARLKILGHLDIAVKRRPQEGHHTYRSRSGIVYDLRISTIPAEQGEKLVIRLLDQTPVQYQLQNLGFFPENLTVMENAVEATNGLILVVGPTGSGKTTTLYSMLNSINSDAKNLLTIEDPVEYHIPGISQVSVKPEQGLTFASALKSFLRQDPDVILVGEIRDPETAEIAIKASLTGHLVLSTLHSVDAVTTIQRLHNLGVDPELLADTLRLIMSQRLIRKQCPHTSQKEQQSCHRCQGSGVAGRTPIYEILSVNDLIKQRIRDGVTGENLIAPHPNLVFQSFTQTAELLISKGQADPQEIETILR